MYDDSSARNFRNGRYILDLQGKVQCIVYASKVGTHRGRLCTDRLEKLRRKVNRSGIDVPHILIIGLRRNNSIGLPRIKNDEVTDIEVFALANAPRQKEWQ